ncbi:DnaJ sub C member 21 [Blomia tropicalis]|nr:DnaJ sub C member 21 [Blomia tropicalis]
MGKETFYEILGVPTNASTDEIKKKYKILALKYHPDKNLKDVQSATAKFNQIQEAYNVLSDPKEREWYDRHKESFHNDQVDVEDHTIDEKYFSNSCYNGFGDGKNSFYSVYRNLFDEIIDQEIPHKNVDEEFNLPRFGNSTTDVDEVKAFYDVWQSFSTAFSFSNLDRYDIRDAPNRRVVRLMEKENKKIRDEARKNRNALIQELVQFVRKRDKRMEAYRKRLEDRAEANRKKSEAHRLKTIENRNREFEKYVEEQKHDTEWISELEEQLKDIETNANVYYKNNKNGKNKRKNKNKNKNVSVEDDNESKQENGDIEEKNVNEHQNEKKVQNIVQDLDEEDEEVEDLLYCQVCNKKFRTINSFSNHEKSKKHLIAFERYSAMLNENDGEDEIEE